MTENPITLACALWPAWKPTQQQADEWRRCLSSFSPAVAASAVRAAYRMSRWKEPRLSAVLDAARSIGSAHLDTCRENAAEAARIRMEEDMREAESGQAMMRCVLGTIQPIALMAALERASDSWGAPRWRELSERPVNEWPQMAVGMTWAATMEDRT